MMMMRVVVVVEAEEEEEVLQTLTWAHLFIYLIIYLVQAVPAYLRIPKKYFYLFPLGPFTGYIYRIFINANSNSLPRKVWLEV